MEKMDDDTSNDCVAIGEDDTDTNNDKPIMSLFKRLIGNDNKQNTVLTNAQIMDILQREFDVNTDEIHVLELDIYLSIMKKFLKDWPQWDNFDQVVNNLRSNGDRETLNSMLTDDYKSLKDYLKMMLEIAEPLAKDALKVVENNQKPVTKDTNDVVMEVHCTRTELNELFYCHPHPKLNNTVFNFTEDATPSRISLHRPTFEAIINWFDFNINININAFSYKRQTVHELCHTLVNKRLKRKTKFSELDTCWEEKATTKTKNISKASILEIIDSISRFNCSNDTNYKFKTDFLLYVVKKDLSNAPDVIKVPGSYRRYMNAHPYVRYLYTEVDIDKNSEAARKYMLQLEEIISPRFEFSLSKWNPNNGLAMSPDDFLNNTRISMECRMCKVKFGGHDLLKDMQQHFLECHNNERDWTCTNCHNLFPMAKLSGMRWFHKC